MFERKGINMVSSKSRVQEFILHSLVPILCSIVVGFIFYQDGVFNRYHSSFQFVWTAVVASIFYNLLICVRSRDAYLGLIVLLFFTLVSTQSTRPMFILRDIFYITGIGTAIIIYVKYFKQNAGNNYLYSAVTLAGLYGLSYMVTSEIHFVIVGTASVDNTPVTFVSLASSTTFWGVLIGFAIGSGITLADKFFGIIKAPNHEPAPNKQNNVGGRKDQ